MFKIKIVPKYVRTKIPAHNTAAKKKKKKKTQTQILEIKN
jgi:hypothetical protein